MAQQPREAARRIAQAQHAEAQRGARERSADREHRLGSGIAAQIATRLEAAELLRHIRHDPAVRRRGGREHRHIGGHLRDQVAQPPVVGAEIVAPVADAVRLVDDEHPDAAHERRQLLLAKAGLLSLSGETSRTSTSSRSSCPSTSVHSCALVELIATARTPARSAARDLIAHERQQRRHEHGRPRTLTPQQQRRDEIDRRLAPAGALHHQRAAAPFDERLDRLVLAVVEVGV